MDDTSFEKDREISTRIATTWGLNADQKERLLDDHEQINALISIYESLQVIFPDDQDRANEWISKPNKAFDGASALEVMLAGDTEKVRSYLRYHVYNA